MSELDRLSALCALGERLDEDDNPIPSPITGIDFIRVANAAQTRLLVFFIVDPDLLVDPLAVVPGSLDLGRISIVSLSTGFPVEVVEALWRNEGTRTVLEITTEEPGDFSLYRLTIDDEDHDPPRIDRFFNGVEFSFKQGCPSVLDCRERDPECPPGELVDFPVDYLARDFTSLRGALLDYAAQRYPQWSERIEADGGVMLAEVMAALGDEFSYIQDRYARESHFEQATQRRSLRRHTRLVDFDIDNGRSATTHLAIQVENAEEPDPANSVGKFVPAGARVWAVHENDRLIPFEIGEGLRDRRRTWIHRDWDEVNAHVPDPSKPCLPSGRSELFLEGTFPEAGQLPEAPGEGDDDGSWEGRHVILKSTPEDPALPMRVHLLRIKEVNYGSDPLCLNEEGTATDYTHITWDDSEALPFDLYLPTTKILANIVPATAGETFEEDFTIGTTGVVEREGPCNEVTGERTTTYLFSLRETERRGLGWLGEQPELELLESPGAADEDPWRYQSSLLEASGQNQVFTLDDGQWRTIFRVERLGEVFEHQDYASGEGFTIRFGDGEFGRLPTSDTSFRIRYRTDVGTVGNVPADTVTILNDPDPAGTAPTLAGEVVKVRNPLPVTTGRDRQAAEIVKYLAPEAYQAETFRAVRDEDYREHAEGVEGVQQAGARARWTGSWLTGFVTADPLGSFQLTEDLKARIANRLDCVRQVGREVFVKPPVYLNLDLEIVICVEPYAYPGQVQERVVRALTKTMQRGAHVDLPFFHPDRFTFGTPLRRADLEAAVQAVPGLRGVLRTFIRVRGVTERRVFSELEFPVADQRILRLQNDPRFPDRGSLRVTVQ